MKTIVILGSTIEGVKAAQEIKKRSPQDKVMVYPLSGHPMCMDQITDVIAKKKTLQDIRYHPGDVRMIQNQNVTRVNLKRKRLHLENKEQVSFDQLIITDTGSWKLPDTKGTAKSGCFFLKSEKDLEAVLDQVLLSEDIVIQTDHFDGILYALALTRRERTVTCAYQGRHILPSVWDEEITQAFLEYCLKEGLKIFPRTTIAEVLGDADVKAVRLSSEKVVAAQCVLWTAARLDLRLFSEPPELRHGLLDINKTYQTTFPDVYAVGNSVSLKTKSTRESEEQGERCARALCCEELPDKTPPPPDCAFQIDHLHVTFFGQLEVYDGLSERSFFQKDPFIYKKWVLENDVLKGALLVNAPQEEEMVRRAFKEKASMEGYYASSHMREMSAQQI